jgi:hypothetical protein
MKDLIDDMIKNLTRDELREFRYFIQRRSSSQSPGEDLKLLEAIRRPGSDREALSNAHRQTRMRIKRSFEQFAGLEYQRANQRARIHNMIDVAHYLFNKNLYKHAWHYLFQAEKAALLQEESVLLNAIYTTQLSYSSAMYAFDRASVDVPELLAKWKVNGDVTNIEGRANAAFAELSYEIREHLSQELYFETGEVLSGILAKYGLNEQLYSHPKIYARVVELVCVALREGKSYVRLKEYAVSSYETLVSRGMTNKIPPDSLMELIRSICAAMFRTKDYVNLVKYSTLFREYAEKFRLQDDKYSYYDFLANMYVIDLCICSDRLPEAREKMGLLYRKYGGRTSTRLYTVLRTNLLNICFLSGDYAGCIRAINELLRVQNAGVFEMVGMEVLLFTEIYRVLVYYEYDDEVDYTYHLLKTLKRRYAETLKQKASSRERLFISILEKILNRPSYVTGKRFVADCKRFIALKEYLPADREYISLNAWLNSRLTGRSYYECLLDLMKG